jgi:hypothetical protein
VIYFYMWLPWMAVTYITRGCEQLTTGPCDEDHRSVPNGVLLCD